MASSAGLRVLESPRDLGQIRSEILAAGYRDEKVVVILPATLWRGRIFGEVAADMLRKAGMNIDLQVMDTASWARRLVSSKPPDEGGWSVFCTAMQGTDALSSATHLALRGNGDKAFAGWPRSPAIEALRDQWFDAPNTAAQRTIARAIQQQSFVDIPYYPLGTFYPSTAYRSNLIGILDEEAGLTCRAIG